MKSSLDISNFLEEISRLSHSIVFFYFFALITEQCFLISPRYPLEFCIQMGISFFSPLAVASLLFFYFYYYFFFLWWILSYIEMKQPWVYMCSPSQCPLPPPSPPAPSRFSQCTRSERLSHASNLGW